MRNRTAIVLTIIFIWTAFAAGQVDRHTGLAKARNKQTQSAHDSIAGVPGPDVKFQSAGPALLPFQVANYTTGPVPYAIAAGDFNGDGHLDIVTADQGNINGDLNNTVGVQLNNGDGTFAPSVAYTVGIGPSKVVVGDFNGDGKLDLAVLNTGTGESDSSVSILLGNGNGTFRAQKVTNLNIQCTGIAVGDFNGDGKLDLVASNYNHGGFSGGTATVEVMLGNGNGTFQSPASYPLPASATNVVVADLRKDGKLDLIVPTENSADVGQIFNDLSILLGNGDGTFEPAVNYIIEDDAVAVAVADFNDDGNLDLAVDNVCGTDPEDCGYSTLSLLLGNGDGTFRPQMIPNLVLGVGVFDIVAADFNGSGQMDLAVASAYESTVSLIFNTGNAAFISSETLVAGNGPLALVAGRFGAGGNGSADLVLANWGDGAPSDSITVMLNQAATILTLESTPNPANAGQNVTLSATVETAIPGAGTPTGTVTFENGTHKLGKAKLVNGVATLKTTKLPAGSNNVVAVYSGDENFNPDVSATLVQVVE